MATKQEIKQITEMAKAVTNGDVAAVPILLDGLRDAGFESLAAVAMREIRVKSYRSESIGVMVLGHLKAVALHESLAKVDLAEVPLMSADRRIERKEQAKLARNLFKLLKVPGISVTCPNYSMVRSVDVVFPNRRDYVISDTDGSISRDDEAFIANSRAERTIEAILAIAFPNHDDRSNSSYDHFDFKWSITSK